MLCRYNLLRLAAGKLPSASDSLFHRNRVGEKNVILQVNVLMQVGFKLLECGKERPVAEARAFWRCIARTKSTDLLEGRAG